MAEDIGMEPCFDMEDPKPRKEALKKMKKPERSAPVVEKQENDDEKAENDQNTEENGEKPMSKTQKRKLKKQLAIERKAAQEAAGEDGVEKEGPEAKKAKKDEESEEKKPKHKGKDKEHSFEAIEQKFSALLGKLTETTTNFKEGEAIIKKEVEDGKVTAEQAHTLYRVYNRNLRLKRLRVKLHKVIGENAHLEEVKQKINDWRAAKKITENDAMLLVKRWKTRENRRIGRQDQKIITSACFHCRETGHRLADCPKRNNSSSDGVCFRCGSTEHSIHECKKKGVKGFPFATCFVCKQVGHISRDCHQNQNGVYPDGGSCNVCGQNTHLRRDCPELAAQKAGAHGAKKQFTARAASNWATQSADADYDPTENSGNFEENSEFSAAKKLPVFKKMGKHIKF